MQEQIQKHLQPIFQTLQQQKKIAEYSKFVQQLIQKLKMPIQQVSEQIQYLVPQYFNYEKIETAQPVCAKILYEGDYGFRCQQCKMQLNSIVCIQCFNKSNHKGHKYMKIPVNGCCDCGNQQMWNPIGSCIDHKGSIQFLEVNAQQTQKFIKDMQYLLSIHYLMSKKTNINILKQTIQLIICQILTQFNMGSLISNEMTAQFFQSKFNNKFNTQISSQNNEKLNEYCVIQYIFQNFGDQYSKSMIQIFIMLFTRPKFKKFLIIKFIQQINKNAVILQSDYIGIGDQVFTSYKLIQQLIENKQLKPLSPKITSKIKKTNSYYQIFYAINIYLRYMAQLNQGVGEKFMRYHILQGNISETIIYNKYFHSLFVSNKNIRYEIQLQTCDKLAVCFSKIKNDKIVILKGMKDLVNYFKQQKDNSLMNLFIPQQRLLILLIFTYFDGKYEDKINYKFLNEIGLTYKVLYRMLQSVLYLLRFCSLNLSNYQTAYRFWQFYQVSMCHNNYLISLNLEIVKFCVLGLQYLQPMEIIYFDQNLSVFYQKEIAFLQNQIPIQNLFALPSKFIQPLIANTQQIKCNQQDIYDRAKALGILTDYIGILNQSLITNHTSLTINNKLQIRNQQQIINFYGQIVKSYNFKTNQFKNFCKVFFQQPFPFCEKFIKQYCEIINQRIQLKKQYQSFFIQINLTYFKSKKNCNSFSFTLQQNQKKCQLQHIPKNHNNEKDYHKLKEIIFNKLFVQKMLIISYQYIQIMSKNEAALKSDMPHFSLYIKQLIKLNYNLQDKSICMLFSGIRDNEKIFNYFPDAIKKQILKILKQNKQQAKTQIQNSPSKSQKNRAKMNQIKSKKLQKFKKKQQNVIKKIEQNQQFQFKNSNHMQGICCMLCKMGNENQQLLALSYIQKSNLLHKYYLQSNKAVYFITTCGHFIHKNCALQIYDNIHNIFCQFCSSYSNILLGDTIKEAKTIKKRKNSLKNIMSQIDNEIENRNEDKTSEIYKQIQQINQLQQIYNNLKIQQYAHIAKIKIMKQQFAYFANFQHAQVVKQIIQHRMQFTNMGILQFIQEQMVDIQFMQVAIIIIQVSQFMQIIWAKHLLAIHVIEYLVAKFVQIIQIIKNSFYLNSKHIRKLKMIQYIKEFSNN